MNQAAAQPSTRVTREHQHVQVLTHVPALPKAFSSITYHNNNNISNEVSMTLCVKVYTVT